MPTYQGISAQRDPFLKGKKGGGGVAAASNSFEELPANRQVGRPTGLGEDCGSGADRAARRVALVVVTRVGAGSDVHEGEHGAGLALALEADGLLVARGRGVLERRLDLVGR